MIYLSNEPYPQEISVPRSFGVIVPHRNEYLSTADIATDLTTDSDTKVLAASQGVALKAMVDAKADASDVYTKTEVDTALQGKADKSDTYTKAQVDSALGGKQDTISDLSAIRSGAAAGATAVQPSGLEAGLATKQDTLVSGTNIKTINNESLLGEGNIDIQGGDPNAVTFTPQTLTDAQKAQARTNIGAGTYSKPANGIPASDLASGVIPSVPTKTSDLQNDSGFVTGQEVSQTYETKSDATAKETALQTAINTKQDTISDLSTIRSGASAGATAVQPAELSAGLATKQDTLESGVNIKTINNESLLGSGNIDIQGGGGGTIDNEVTKDSANAVKSSGIYAALGKYGVISQTQTWTRAAGPDYGFDHVMSGQVYGFIPNYFIELWKSRGGETAKFNEVTGYFEYLDLSDISYEEAQKIYSCAIPSFVAYAYAQDSSQKVKIPRAIFPQIGSGGDQQNHDITRFLYVCDGVESMTFESLMNEFSRVNNLSAAFYYARKLKSIDGDLRIYTTSGMTGNSGAFVELWSLENIKIKIAANANIEFKSSSRLSLDSVVYMVTNATNTSAITITLNATAYARAIADADVQAALQNHPLITLASA